MGRDGWDRTDVGPIEAGWRQVRFGTSGQLLSQSQSWARIVLSPTRVRFEDGRLSGPQFASGSRPSSGGQEKGGQTSVGRWGTNTYIVAQSIGPTDLAGEGKWYSTGR